MADTKKVAEEKPKGPLGKLKEVAEDKEEQLQYLATLIRAVSYTHLTLPTICRV